MIGALIEVALIVAALVAAAVTFFGVVRPALAGRQHRATLANIARLERELGFDVPLEARIDLELGIRSDAYQLHCTACNAVLAEASDPMPAAYSARLIDDHWKRFHGVLPRPYSVPVKPPKPQRYKRGQFRTKWGQQWP